MSPTRTWVCCSRLVACFMSELQIPSCLNAQKLLNSKDLSSRISIMNCHTTTTTTTTTTDHPCTSLIQCYSIWCQWNHLVILWKSPVGLLVASTLVVSFVPYSRHQNDCCLNLASWGSTVPSFHLQLWQRRIRKSDVFHEVWPCGNVLDEVW